MVVEGGDGVWNESVALGVKNGCDSRKYSSSLEEGFPTDCDPVRRQILIEDGASYVLL